MLLHESCSEMGGIEIEGEGEGLGQNGSLISKPILTHRVWGVENWLIDSFFLILL